MYSVSAYGSMMADKARMDAYVEALRKSVAPHTVVVDLGAGTGIFSLLAARFGARRVYAIERDDVIQLARQIARANGLADKIEFIQDSSTDITLPERADVLVSDLRGVLPHFSQHIPHIVDARERFLAPGGVMIPQRDYLWAAIIESSELYDPPTKPLQQNHGFDHSFAREAVINTWWKGGTRPDQLLTTPKCWATLDYSSIQSPDSSAELDWNVIRNGTGHGIAIWFDSVLTDDIGFSNAPGCKTIYQNGFFPWASAVKLAQGDKIHLNFHADLVGDDYMFRWQTFVSSSKGHQKARFDQSTFHGVPLSPQSLRKMSSHYLATLNETGRIDRLVLDLMSQGYSLGKIADQLQAQFSGSFKEWKDALTRAAELSQKYCG